VSLIHATSIFDERLPIQSEFSVLKINLMAIPSIVVISAVSARAQLDPFRVLRASSLAVACSHCDPTGNEEPNDEDEFFFGSAAAPTVTHYASCGSGANA
jgi:hypothetical protein